MIRIEIEIQFIVILHLIRTETISGFAVGEEDSLFKVSKSGNSQFRWEFGWNDGSFN